MAAKFDILKAQNELRRIVFQHCVQYNLLKAEHLTRLLISQTIAECNKAFITLDKRVAQVCAFLRMQLTCSADGLV